MTARDELAATIYVTACGYSTPDIPFADLFEVDREEYHEAADAIIDAGWVSPSTAAEIDALLDDCSQDGRDERNFVRVSAVRGLLHSAMRMPEDRDATLQADAHEAHIVRGSE